MKRLRTENVNMFSVLEENKSLRQQLEKTTEKDEENENLDGVQKEFQDTLNSFAETFTNNKEGVDEQTAEAAMNNMEKNMSHVFEKMESMFDNVQGEQKET